MYGPNRDQLQPGAYEAACGFPCFCGKHRAGTYTLQGLHERYRCPEAAELVERYPMPGRRAGKQQAILDETFDWLPAPRTEDRLLSGFRIPPTEAQMRVMARGFDPKPVRYGSAGWLGWMIRRQTVEHLERIDAERAWENEGGR